MLSASAYPFQQQRRALTSTHIAVSAVCQPDPAQRDYFGAHTYRRIDKDGVFHTQV